MRLLARVKPSNSTQQRSKAQTILLRPYTDYHIAATQSFSWQSPPPLSPRMSINSSDFMSPIHVLTYPPSTNASHSTLVFICPTALHNKSTQSPIPNALTSPQTTYTYIPFYIALTGTPILSIAPIRTGAACTLPAYILRAPISLIP